MKRHHSFHAVVFAVALLVTALAARVSPWSGELLFFVGMALLVAAWAFSQLLLTLKTKGLTLGQLESAVMQLPWAVLLLDEGDAIRFENAAAIRLTGHEAGHLLGRPVWQLLPTWSQLRDALLAAAAQPSEREPFWQSATLTGRFAAIPVGVRLLRVAHEGGQRTVALLKDQRSEQRVSDSLWRMRQIVNEAGWGIVVGTAGPQPTYEVVNPAFARMVGYAPEELQGLSITTCIAPSHVAQAMHLRDHAEREGHARGEMRHRHRQGHEFPTLVDLSVVRDGRGEVQCFVVSVQDITELKHIEERLNRSVSRLHSVLDALPVGVWIASEQGVVEQTNPAAKRLWLGGQAAAEGAGPWWARAASAELQHDSLLRRAAVTNEQLDGGVTEALTGDGRRHVILTTASPMKDEAGRIIGAVAVDEDLTAVRQGDEALRRAYALLERIINTSAVGMAVCDAKGVISRTNVAWRAQMGQAPVALGGEVEGGTSLVALFMPEDQPRVVEVMVRMAQGATPSHLGEYRLLRASAQHAWCMVFISRLPATEGVGQLLVQVIDTDSRRVAMEELSASQGRLAAAQRLAGIGDWVWQLDEDLLERSDQLLALLGAAASGRQANLQAGLLDFILPADRLRVIALLEAALEPGGRFSADCQMRRTDGATIDVYIQGVMQVSTTTRRMAGTLQDVTDRKRTEDDLMQSRERLRELMLHEDQVIEQERKRIAREVHDELGQLVTALRMDLSMLRGQLDPAACGPAERADRMGETMGRMSDVVRHVASNLRPGALDMGLVAAMEWLAEDFSLRWEVACRFDPPHEDAPELPEAAALALFRAAQESLTNVAKHACATRVEIRLAREGQDWHLSIRDNGRGFDVASVQARRRSGLGLLGMRERMRAIGATLDMVSGPTGTIIDIRCPADMAQAAGPNP